MERGNADIGDLPSSCTGEQIRKRAAPDSLDSSNSDERRDCSDTAKTARTELQKRAVVSLLFGGVEEELRKKVITSIEQTIEQLKDDVEVEIFDAEDVTDSFQQFCDDDRPTRGLEKDFSAEDKFNVAFLPYFVRGCESDSASKKTAVDLFSAAFGLVEPRWQSKLKAVNLDLKHEPNRTWCIEEWRKKFSASAKQDTQEGAGKNLSYLELNAANGNLDLAGIFREPPRRFTVLRFCVGSQSVAFCVVLKNAEDFISVRDAVQSVDETFCPQSFTITLSCGQFEARIVLSDPSTLSIDDLRQNILHALTDRTLARPEIMIFEGLEKARVTSIEVVSINGRGKDRDPVFLKSGMLSAYLATFKSLDRDIRTVQDIETCDMRVQFNKRAAKPILADELPGPATGPGVKPTVYPQQKSVANRLYQRLLALLRIRGKEQGREMSSFESFEFLVLVPPFRTLQEQTLQDVEKIVSSEATEANVLLRVDRKPKDADADADVEKEASIYEQRYQQFYRKIAQDHREETFFVIVVDESHYGPTAGSFYDKVVNDGARSGEMLKKSNVAVLLVSATPYCNITSDSWLPERYVTQFSDSLGQGEVLSWRERLSEDDCCNLEELHVVDWFPPQHKDCEVSRYFRLEDYLSTVPSRSESRSVHEQRIRCDSWLDRIDGKLLDVTDSQFLELSATDKLDHEFCVWMLLDYLFSLTYVRVFCLQEDELSSWPEYEKRTETFLEEFRECIKRLPKLDEDIARMAVGGSKKETPKALQQVQQMLKESILEQKRKHFLAQTKDFTCNRMLDEDVRKVVDKLHDCAPGVTLDALSQHLDEHGSGPDSAREDREDTADMEFAADDENRVFTFLFWRKEVERKGAGGRQFPGHRCLLSETDRIVISALNTSTSNGIVSGGTMTVIRTPSKLLGSLFAQGLRLARDQIDEQIQQSFGVLTDFGDAKLSTSIEPKYRRMKLLVNAGDGNGNVHSLNTLEAGLAEKLGRKDVLQYRHLEGLPCILILVDKGRMGDVFPHSFSCLDLRCQTNNDNFTTLVQELGRMCRYPRNSSSTTEAAGLISSSKDVAVYDEDTFLGFGTMVSGDSGFGRRLVALSKKLRVRMSSTEGHAGWKKIPLSEQLPYALIMSTTMIKIQQAVDDAIKLQKHGKEMEIQRCVRLGTSLDRYHQRVSTSKRAKQRKNSAELSLELRQLHTYRGAYRASTQDKNKISAKKANFDRYKRGDLKHHDLRLLLKAECQIGKTGTFCWFLRLIQDAIVGHTYDVDVRISRALATADPLRWAIPYWEDLTRSNQPFCIKPRFAKYHEKIKLERMAHLLKIARSDPGRWVTAFKDSVVAVRGECITCRDWFEKLDVLVSKYSGSPCPIQWGGGGSEFAVSKEGAEALKNAVDFHLPESERKPGSECSVFYPKRIYEKFGRNSDCRLAQMPDPVALSYGGVDYVRLIRASESETIYVQEKEIPPVHELTGWSAPPSPAAAKEGNQEKPQAAGEVITVSISADSSLFARAYTSSSSTSVEKLRLADRIEAHGTQFDLHSLFPSISSHGPGGIEVAGRHANAVFQLNENGHISGIAKAGAPAGHRGLRFWVFTPSANRHLKSANKALLERPFRVSGEDSPPVQVLVVPPKEFHQYVTDFGDSYTVVGLPDTVHLGPILAVCRSRTSQSSPLSHLEHEVLTQESGKIGFSRLFCQIFAYLLELPAIWVLDDNVRTCVRVDPSPSREDGSVQATCKVCFFDDAMLEIEQVFFGDDDADEVQLGVHQAVISSLERAACPDKSPRCVTRNDHAGRTAKSLKEYRGAQRHFGIIGMQRDNQLKGSKAIKRAFKVTPSVYSFYLLNIFDTVSRGILFLPKPWWEDIEFNQLCEEAHLLVLKCNRFIHSKPNMHPTSKHRNRELANSSLEPMREDGPVMHDVEERQEAVQEVAQADLEASQEAKQEGQPAMQEGQEPMQEDGQAVVAVLVSQPQERQVDKQQSEASNHPIKTVLQELSSDETSTSRERMCAVLLSLRRYICRALYPESDAGPAGLDATSWEREGILMALDKCQFRLDRPERRTLAFIGAEDAGKSFLINLLLGLLPPRTHRYGFLGMSDEGAEESKSKLLVSFLEAVHDLELHLREVDGVMVYGEGIDTSTGLAVQLQRYLEENDVVQYVKGNYTQEGFLEEGRREQEWAEVQNLKKAWKTWPSGDMEKSQYILPSLQGIQTINQINIRHGTIFHFWIRYKSKLQLQGELASIVDSLQNLDDDMVVSEKRRLKDKFEVLTGQKFKLKEADAAGLCERLKEVMGKDVIVSGRGFHPLDDRIYVRDKLKERLTDKTQSCAIEQCCVYCPSELLERGLELIDTPPAVSKHLNASLVSTCESADFVVSLDSLANTDNSVATLLTECGALSRVVRQDKDKECNLVIFWPANEKTMCMTASSLQSALDSADSEATRNLAGFGSVFRNLKQNLGDEKELVEKDQYSEAMRKQEEKVMCGLPLLWASLCMDEQEARRELDSLVQGRYDFVYEKTNGQALLRALFNIRPKPDNVLVQFLKYVRSSSYGIISGKDLIPATTLERLKRKLELDDVKGIEKRYQERVMNKLWSRLKAAVGEESGQLKAFCAPITAEAEPHKISQRVTKFVRDTQKARREALKTAFDTKTDKTSSIGVWNKTFAGWFPKPQSQEVDDLVTSLNTMLNLLVIEPPDAVVEENRARAQLVVDVEEWLMEEMLLLYGPSKAADQDALRAKILPVLQTTAKRMLETTRWQPNSKVGWVPKSSVYKLVDRAKVKSVKTLCEKASGRINELKGKPDWRDGYAEAFSEKNMEELVRDLATELRREAGKVVTARVEAAASKALVGLKKGRRQSTLSTFSSKVVAACAADVLNAFEPDPARKKKHDELLTMCDDVEKFVHDQMMFQNEEHEFQVLLKRVKTAGAREEAAPELSPPGWEEEGRPKKKKCIET